MATEINPNTGQYVVVAGALRQAAAHQNAVILALSIQKGTMPGRPNMGADWGRRALKSAAIAEDIALTALAPLVAEGTITDPMVTATINAPKGRVNLSIYYRVGATRHNFTLFRRV